MGKGKTRTGRGGGSWSTRKALKLAKAAGLEVFDKPKSSLVVVRAPSGDRISFSKLEHNITRSVKAWLLEHGCEG